MPSTIICINPWIYDFAAHDLWAKPLGILKIAGILRNLGLDVILIDCLDIYNPDIPLHRRPKRKRYGTGKFFKKRIPPPEPLRGYGREYYRYGISEDTFIKELKRVESPSAIFITSLMTYWYPGVFRAIDISKKIHPDVPIVLGGIYATLCREHANRFSNADLIIDCRDDSIEDQIINILDELGIPYDRKIKKKNPYPAFNLLYGLDYICIQTSTGCPFRCSYCASPYLFPEFMRRDPEEVFEEILYWNREYGIRDFAFYDDALLFDFENHLFQILKRVIDKGLNLRFHTPNALHIRWIDRDVAELMYLSGFKTIRLGLESIDSAFHRKLDNKVSEEEFKSSVLALRKAGFKRDQIGTYIMIGLPDQDISSIIESIQIAGSMGTIPYLAEYSPLPHTPLWKRAVEVSPWDLTQEPLFHNNTLIPCWSEEKKWMISKIKAISLRFRQR